MDATGFSPEDCASCKGQAVGPNQIPCGPCGGKGRVLVMQPSISCPRCGGSGQKEQTGFWSSAEHCVICLGLDGLGLSSILSEFRTIPLHSQPDRPTCTRILKRLAIETRERSRIKPSNASLCFSLNSEFHRLFPFICGVFYFQPRPRMPGPSIYGLLLSLATTLLQSVFYLDSGPLRTSPIKNQAFMNQR